MLDRLVLRTGLPRTVVVLSVVSLLNDSASEMITPLLPVFLTATLGAGPAIVGLVEGVAETASGLLKLLSGWLADRGWNAKRLVVGGYTVSNCTRPLVAFALGWTFVLAMRFLDRVGKGLRTAPRDALIAAAVPESQRGRAFGFHRGMDHAGAMLGPLFAFALIALGADLSQVFLASMIPGAAVLLLLVLGLEHQAPALAPARPPAFRWAALDARLRGLIVASGGLALATVPEAFLIVWATVQGLDALWVPLLWSAAHVVKTAVAIPAGALSDRIGRLPVVLAGWTLRVLCLAAIAFAGPGTGLVWLLFFAYAAALAATEGAESALIGDHAPANLKGTAFGVYHLVRSLVALPGAFLFGVLWEQVSMPAAFLAAAVLTAVSALALVIFARRRVDTGNV